MPRAAPGARSRFVARMPAMSPPERDEPAVLAVAARTMFTHDAGGRIGFINEPDGPRAPRVFLIWNGDGTLWRARDDLPPALVARIAELVAAQPPTSELAQPPACVAAVRAALAAHAPVGDDALRGGFEYHFPDAIAAAPGETAVVAVTADNAGVLARWLADWASYATWQLPVRAAVVDGAAVSICACVRTPGEATAAGIETHPAFRGRGLAVAATAAWARAVRDRGLVPIYGTGWDNRASQRVAAKLGLLRFAGTLSIA